VVTGRLAIGGAGGILAVGSLCFLGAFLIVDGVTGLYVLIEEYSADTAWAVLFAFPALVLSYVFGLIATTASHQVLARVRGHGPNEELEQFVRVAAADNEALSERYLSLVQHQALLEGASLGFVIMFIGAIFAVRWLGPFGSFGWLASLGFLGLAAICPILAAGLAKKAEYLASHSGSHE
jgi:hypothetical protein